MKHSLALQAGTIALDGEVLSSSFGLFLLLDGHVPEGVLTSGDWEELVVSDCFLGTRQNSLRFISEEPSSWTTSGAQNLRPVQLASALGSFCGERSGPVRLTLWFWGSFLTHLAISAEERLLRVLV